MVNEYTFVFIFLIINIALSLALLLVAYLVAPRLLYAEKASTYECGYKPFGDARMRFSVHYYLVSILFLIFDLEIAFMFPWAISLDKFHYTENLAMVLFLFILVLGFVYEWRKGGMDW